ncbi:MAG: TetR/AcrR family transcriptional regulator [Roseobacter sp.]
MKQLITKTAQRLFQNEGYATVSMRRLAKETGCSPMTLYKYFDGKIAILQTLWAVVFTDLFGKLRDRIESDTEEKEKLRIACRHYVGYWLEHPEHYRLVFMAEGVMQQDVSMFIDNPEIEAGFGLLAQLVVDASDDTIGSAATKIKIDLIMGALHGIAHNRITISGYPWSDTNALIDQLVFDLF